MNDEEGTFFSSELQEQNDTIEYDIQWDDCSYGGTEVESYDPWFLMISDTIVEKAVEKVSLKNG